MSAQQFFKYSSQTIMALLLALAVSSCNRNIIETTNYENVKAKDVVSMMDTLHLQFDELKARFKIKADLNGDSKSFNADMRWKNDEQIWMSFSIFGFEGIRALFTQDSVKIINKLQKEYYFGTYENLENLSQVPLTFNEIEDLFLGKMLPIQDKRPDVRLKGDVVLLGLQDDDYMAKAEVDRKSLSIQHFLITSLLQSRSLDVTLTDYQQIDNKNWPNKRTYSIISGSNYLNIEATAQKVVLNEKLDYPFYVNEKYKYISLQFLR